MTMVEPPPLDPLTGDEKLLGLDASVSDFWRFALPDVTTNNVRGWLAEYLVWRATGVERPVRVEWDAFDVLWGDIRIEVKSSAFVQRWAQRQPSTLAFSGLRGKLLDPVTNTYAAESTYNADVYVLAANLAGREQFDQLDIGNWRFAVCQWPIGTARGRPAEMPAGGHGNCPLMANRSAHQGVGGVGHVEGVVV
ncbi:hypothetical protein ACLBWV_17540 [Microbacterium paraoxydans]